MMIKDSKHYRWWVVFLLWTGCVTNAMDRGSLGVAAPYIMKDLGLDPALMGIVLSSFFWTYTAMNIPAGLLADKFGSKAALGWSAFLWSALTALTGTATSYIQLIAFRLGVGAGEAGIQPINIKVVKNNFPTEERGTAVGMYNSGMRVGLAIVPVLMAFLMSAWNWRVAFYITGIISVSWVAMWYFTFKSDKPEPVKPGEVVEKIPWRELLKHRTIVGIVISKFFQDYMYFVFVTWLPAYLVMERGFTIIKMGWYASMPWIITFCALPVVGILSDTLIKRGMTVTNSRKGMIIGGHAVASLVVFAVYTDNALVAMWLMTIAVVFESSASTIMMVTCAEIAPPNAAGAVAGIMNTAAGLAGIVAPIITGVLLKLTGSFQQAFALASVFIIIAALTMWFVVGKIEQITFDKKPAADTTISG
ncbi:MAG: MFS transporter [Negativicutes bacterium]|nr:MFS transporter [Negativicutes bacterium]